MAMEVADFPPDFVIGGMLTQELKKVKSDVGQKDSNTIPQMDGEDDDEDEEVVAPDVFIFKDGALISTKEPEDGLGSDLDSDNDDDEDEEYDNLVVCQFEKVSHVRNRWKCSLKDGIMNIDGKDYIFARASGDFEW